jgi:hypothetical protein
MKLQPKYLTLIDHDIGPLGRRCEYREGGLMFCFYFFIFFLLSTFLEILLGGAPIRRSGKIGNALT